MTLIVETGAGVRGANSYVLAAFVTAYLTDRGRESENSWDTIGLPAQEAACIKATDYIEKRWGPKFKGQRAVSFTGSQARGSIEFTGLPADGETITINTSTYTFRTALAAPGDIIIGADADGCALNLVAALTGGDTAGANYALRTPVLPGYEVAIDGTNAALVLIDAPYDGEAGNDTTFATTVAQATLSSFSGGLDGGNQPLEFPRSRLRLPDGSLVQGIPRNLKWAAAEYAVRAVTASLQPDDTSLSSSAGQISQGPITKTRQKIDVIEVETTWGATSSLGDVLTPYPAADQLLADYVVNSSIFGRVARA